MGAAHLISILPIIYLYIHCYYSLSPAGLRLTKQESYRSHASVYAHKQSAATLAHTQIETPEQIKAYPHTVVALQDHEGLDPKYQLISSMADLPTSYSQTDQHYVAQSPAKGTAPSCMLNVISA